MLLSQEHYVQSDVCEVTMKIVRKGILFAFLLIAILSLSSCFKAVKIGHEAELTGEKKFDANANVSDMWDTVLLPELSDKAVDLCKLYTEADGDYSKVSKFGRYSMGSSGELNFTVKGTAEVKENHTDKKAGYLTVAVEGLPEDQIVKLQVGKLFKGTAVRDNLDTISYDDYKNQIEWASISQSLNNKVLDTVLDKYDPSSWKVGTRIKFTGCFTVATDKDEILITPVKVEVL
jgi:predicted lipoprotein